jgi:hypothetical protein
VSKYDEEPAYTYTDVPALIEENERLWAVAMAAKALIADPEWCSCLTINPNSRHAHDRPNLDYPATCEICGAFGCSGWELVDALAALEDTDEAR